MASTTYTFDLGDRLVDIDDSANGIITPTYDDLDRLTEETTPQGTVTYEYDDDGRAHDDDGGESDGGRVRV
jgi:hypothetical protein